jgi:toxin ParE2
VTVRFLAEAEAELDEAVEYYNAQVSGLGTEFAREVRDGLTRIAEFPRNWQQLRHHIRRYRLRRFPYGLVYAEFESEIVVVAVMHLHRKPEYWRKRLTRT